MPQEIQTKSGVIYQTLPDEKLRQNDQELLIILYSLLSVESQQIVKDLLSPDYVSYLERKVEKLKVRSNGPSIDLSK